MLVVPTPGPGFTADVSQVAGLKEELNLVGNQYNVLLSMASAG